MESYNASNSLAIYSSLWMVKTEPIEKFSVLAIASGVRRRPCSIRARTAVIFPLQTDVDGLPLRTPCSTTSHPYLKRVIHFETIDFFVALSP